MKQEITYEDYSKVEIKIGTVLRVKKNEKARKPSFVVEVDFGKEIGIKKSSAQITHYYKEQNLVGKQVIGVCNFAKKNNLECHAGHGLKYEDVKQIAKINEISELNIGHFIIGEAVFVGLKKSILKMRKIIDNSRKKNFYLKSA